MYKRVEDWLDFATSGQCHAGLSPDSRMFLLLASAGEMLAPVWCVRMEEVNA